MAAMAALPLDLSASACPLIVGDTSLSGDASVGWDSLLAAAVDEDDGGAAPPAGLVAFFSFSYTEYTCSKFWVPMAWDTAALSAGSTPKVSDMQFTAMSTESLSSACRVPSVRHVERKSQIASARRCLDVVA